MEQHPLQERDGPVPLLEQSVAERVRERERAQRAHRVREERVGAVERVDEAPAVGAARPAPRLHGPARLERQLAQLAFATVGLVAALENQPSQRAPGADVVEAVVVDAHVRQVRGHVREGALAAQLEERALVRRVELQQGRAELEALRPVGPATRRVAAAQREDRRAVGRVPGLLEREDLPGGERPHAVDRRTQVRGAQRLVDPHHAFVSPVPRGSRVGLGPLGVALVDADREAEVEPLRQLLGEPFADVLDRRIVHEVVPVPVVVAREDGTDLALEVGEVDDHAVPHLPFHDHLDTVGVPVQPAALGVPGQEMGTIEVVGDPETHETHEGTSL